MRRLGVSRSGAVHAVKTGRVRATKAQPAADARTHFETYCLGCHSGKTPKGGFALDRLLDAKGKDADRRQWEKVWKIVRHEFMPPAHADRPTDRERRAMTRWVERAVFKVEEARPTRQGLLGKHVEHLRRYRSVGLFG